MHKIQIMKKIYYSTLLFSVIGLLSLQVFSQSVPEILYYNFNQQGSTKIPNFASAPPTGTDSATIAGTMFIDSTGQCGHALVGSGLSGSSDFLNTNWVTSLSGSWTISFWTKNIQPSATLYYVFGDANAMSLRCFTNGVAGANNWVLRGPVSDVYINGAAVVAPTMATFVYDTLADNIKGYLNGTLVTTVAQSPNIVISGTGPFKVGSYSSNTGLPAGGLMDEFRLYNRALSDSEVASLYNLTTYDTINDISCAPFVSPSGNHIWTIAGQYKDTIPNVYGCDSVITFNLTFPYVDVEVSQAGITLTALEASAESYQWVNCDNGYSPVSGATSRFFTPTSDGNYAVIVTKVCTDTSACYNVTGVGINNENTAKTGIYPNPAVNDFFVETTGIAQEIFITDLNGKVVLQQIPVSPKTKISVKNIPSGVYIVSIRKEDCIEQHYISIK